MKVPGLYVPLASSHAVFARGGNYVDEVGDRLDGFGPIRAVNILIGPNNSGKSRFMRGLLANTVFELAPGPFEGWRHAKVAAEALSKLPDTVINWQSRGDRLPEDPDVAAALESGGRQVQVEINGTALMTHLEAGPFVSDRRLARAIRVRHKLFPHVASDLSQMYRQGASIRFEHVAIVWQERDGSQQAHPHLTTLGSYLTARAGVGDNVTTLAYLHYIPTIRSGLRLGIDTEAFRGAIAKLYNLGSNHHLHTGQELYDGIDTALRGSRADRERLRSFENWLSSSFFSGKPLAIVPRHLLQGHHLALDIDGVYRDIQDVGDGLQQIILLTFPLFMARPKSLFFIEEPETHLHPGLQRAFIQVLLSEELRQRDLIVFITTHSNHLLDSAFTHPADVSLFSFRQQENLTPGDSGDSGAFTVRHVSDRDVALLDSLGAKNSSVFLAQCQIWCEGPSDRIYLRAYLEALQDHYATRTSHGTFDRLLEDRDFAFVSYGGSLLDSVDFGTAFPADSAVSADLEDEDSGLDPFSIGSRIFLLADRDGPNKIARHAQFDAVARTNPALEYRQLSVREIENTLSPEQLTSALTALFPRLRDKLNGGLVDLPADTRLEDHLRELGLKKQWNQKPGLARKVCESTLRWDDLTPAAREVAEAMDRFIRMSCGFRAVP